MRMFKVLLLVITTMLASQALAKVDDISVQAFSELASNERLLLDVRTPGEYASGYIADAVNMPVGQLPSTFNKIKDKQQTIVVYCRSGRRAANAIEFLQSQGFTNVSHLEGDFMQWEEAGRDITIPAK
ncbi:MAG: rhodanese-like domain-containing protein [Glaciecola sp.]